MTSPDPTPSPTPLPPEQRCGSEVQFHNHIYQCEMARTHTDRCLADTTDDRDVSRVVTLRWWRNGLRPDGQ